MFSFLKKLLRQIRFPGFSDHSWADDPELSWMIPPVDQRDAEAWDHFWTKHMEHGFGPPLHDMFCNDRELISVMNDRGMKSVLCAGSGISQEPRALAEAGFRVAALDISPKAAEIARSYEFTAEVLEFFCGAGSQRPGGSVEFIVGDFLNPALCPGPYDLIIERRTAQNYLENDRVLVLEALANRLSPEGVFLSHCHDNQGGPGRRARHFTESWFEENGWQIRRGEIGKAPSGRFALLETSTG